MRKKQTPKKRSKILTAPEGMELAPGVRPGDLVILAKDGPWLMRLQDGVSKPLLVPLYRPIKLPRLLTEEDLRQLDRQIRKPGEL